MPDQEPFIGALRSAYAASPSLPDSGERAAAIVRETVETLLAGAASMEEIGDAVVQRLASAAAFSSSDGGEREALTEIYALTLPVRTVKQTRAERGATLGRISAVAGRALASSSPPAGGEAPSWREVLDALLIATCWSGRYEWPEGVTIDDLCARRLAWSGTDHTGEGECDATPQGETFVNRILERMVLAQGIAPAGGEGRLARHIARASANVRATAAYQHRAGGESDDAPTSTAVDRIREADARAAVGGGVGGGQFTITLTGTVEVDSATILDHLLDELRELVQAHTDVRAVEVEAGPGPAGRAARQWLESRVSVSPDEEGERRTDRAIFAETIGEVARDLRVADAPELHDLYTTWRLANGGADVELLPDVHAACYAIDRIIGLKTAMRAAGEGRERWRRRAVEAGWSPPSAGEGDGDAA